MSARVRHRGPDGDGEWFSADGRVGLGHRRLSIVDLSTRAAQPMANEDGAIQLVFNGEIYNHAEIRAELETLGGHRWRTDHSDTEVVIHAYEQWGTECVERFRGDFAIALWDSRKDRLWLIRDRAGVKPLYYAHVSGGLAFASEIKALFELPQVPRRMKEQSVYHYLSFLVPPAPDTMFEGIYKLASATQMIVTGTGSVRTERYWDPLENADPLTGVPEKEIQERVLDELRTSVRYRKVSDVPVGIFLSGGVDSSANAALFSEDGDEVRTFSIGFDTDYPSYKSELPYARQVAEMLGAEHHERRLSMEDVISFTEKMVYHQDEPIGDVVCVPLYYVAELARDAGVIVCQVGEGADELFCGYPFWGRHLQLARWNSKPVPRWMKRVALIGLGAAGRGGTYEYELLRRAVAGEPTFWGGAEGMTEGEKSRVLGPDLLREFSGRTSAEVLEPILRDYESRAWEPSALNWMTYLDLRLRLPELLLARVDKMTMATSVEGRVPFLDHKLIELAFSVPSELKTKDRELKGLLRRSVRGIVPSNILDRPKQGFGLPMKEWLGGALGDEVQARVASFAKDTGVLDAGVVSEFLGEANWSKAWFLYNLAVWHDAYIVRTPRAP